jgi:hypothetical protein
MKRKKLDYEDPNIAKIGYNTSENAQIVSQLIKRYLERFL